MVEAYNQIAGRNLDRIAALSDGVFAFAMTLLVLDIRVPVPEAVHGELDLVRALVAVAPRFVMYLMSFLTLGIFWTGQQTQLNRFQRSDRNLGWIHIAFLAVVVIVPFSTSLLAEYTSYRTALLVYWANILLLGVVLYCSWSYASRAGLLEDGAEAEFGAAVRRRIVVGRALYAASALLCVVDTYWSIAFIVMVQLNFAIAPRLGALFRA